jgi:hypothetical protein
MPQYLCFNATAGDEKPERSGGFLSPLAGLVMHFVDYSFRFPGTNETVFFYAYDHFQLFSQTTVPISLRHNLSMGL